MSVLYKATSLTFMFLPVIVLVIDVYDLSVPVSPHCTATQTRRVVLNLRHVMCVFGQRQDKTEGVRLLGNARVRPKSHRL